MASQGADQAILPRSNYPWGEEAWNHARSPTSCAGTSSTTARCTGPGEEVHVKGWLRRIGGRQNGDVGLVGAAVTGVDYQIIDSQGNVIGSGRWMSTPSAALT